MIRVGLLDRVMRLERPDRIEAADGAADVVYADTGAVFVAIAPASLAQRQILNRTDGVATHVATLRTGNDILGGWRLRDGMRVFRVLAIDDSDRRSGFITCLVEEEGR